MRTLLAGALAALCMMSNAHSQARETQSPTVAVEPSLDWGAWPKMSLGMPLTKAFETFQDRTGVGIKPTATEPDSPIQGYEASYARDGADVLEAFSVNKRSGLVTGYSLRLKSGAPCERLIRELTAQYGAPSPSGFGALFEGTPGLAWKPPGIDQQIRVRLSKSSSPRACDLLVAHV